MSDSATLTVPTVRSDLGTNVQQALLDALSEDPGRVLRSLRSAPRRLRAAEQQGGRVVLDDPAVRSAFVYAEHPQQVLLLARALASAGRRMLGLTSTRARVVLLDAAAGAGLVALAHVAARTVPDLRHLDVDLVDQEGGWERARATTLDATLPRLWDGQVQRRTHHLDVEGAGARRALCDLVAAADLVLVPAAMLDAGQAGTSAGLGDALHGALGADTRLLASEPGSQSRPSTDRATRSAQTPPGSGGRGAGDLLVLLDVPVRIPSAGVLPLVRAELFGEESGLAPPPQVHARVRLVGRRTALGSGPQPTWS